MDDNKINERQEKIELLTKQLEDGVKAFSNSEEYKKYLSFMSRFHNYSFTNSMIIFLTKPESTLCASFTTWKAAKRFVKKGEKGIPIFCPAFKKIEEPVIDKQGKPMYDSDGKAITETKMLPRYTLGYTYDVSQTDGEPLPELTKELKGDVADFEKMSAAIQSCTTAPVTFEKIPGSAKGFYSPSEHRIAIQKGMSDLQTLKTMVHECAHSLCDTIEKKNNGELLADTFGKETRAESVAFVVCSHFGIDTSDYSFPYVTSWSTKDFKELRDEMSNIQQVSDQIISGMEKHLGIIPDKFLSEAKEQAAKVKKAPSKRGSKGRKR